MPPAPLVRAADRLRAWLARRGLSHARLAQVRLQAHTFVSPRDAAQMGEMFTWAQTYLSRPHPELGRKGAVCPFVPKALKDDRFLVTLCHAVDRGDDRLVADQLLAHVHHFEVQWPAQGDGDAYDSLLLTFPHLPSAQGACLDRVHTRYKSALMRAGIMLTQFHPLCTKPGIYSPTFAAYTAPYPCIAIRHMGVHDIVFVAHNRAAFRTYRRRFGARYDAGRVSNERGNVDRYLAAVARFAG